MTEKNAQFNFPELLNSKEVVKKLSSQDFLNFGLHEVAYVRAVNLAGQEAFAVHAADGTPLSVMESLESALAVIKHNDLETIAVH